MLRRRDAQLEKDYAYCEAIIKDHSKSFYYAFSQLPEEKAKAVYAIYAFCRRADDSVDKAPTKEAQASALKKLTNELELFERGEEIDSPLWRSLRDVFDRYDCSMQAYFDQIRGQEMDSRFVQPKTMNELEEYSYFVAGSVGLMLLPVLATQRKTDLSQMAKSLGIAMQLTNILRDVGEDYEEIGRVYLPNELLVQEAVPKEIFKNKEITAGFVRVWELVAQRAEEMYEAFESNGHYFDADSRFPVHLSARVYRGILDAVRENDYDCLTQRNFVKPKKMNALYRELKTES